MGCTYPSFYVRPFLPLVSFEVETVVISDPGFFVLGFVAADLSRSVVVGLVVELEVVSVVAELQVPALASVAVEPEVVSVISDPEAFVLAFVAVEPEVVFVAVASVAHVAGPQASVDTPVAFAVLVPVSVFAVEADSSGRPKFLAFPNVGRYAISSSSVEVGGGESSQSSTGGRANPGACGILSSLGLHQNRNLEHGYNKPIPGRNNVSDTNDLPMGATTSHSRKTDLPQCKEQHRHRSYRGSRSPPEVPRIQ